MQNVTVSVDIHIIFQIHVTPLHVCLEVIALRWLEVTSAHATQASQGPDVNQTYPETNVTMLIVEGMVLV